MRIQFASDLHLEFKENLAYIQSNPFEVTGDILILAGDTFYLNDTTMPKIRFWKWASQNYQQVMLLLGNHEFYNNGDVIARVTELGNFIIDSQIDYWIYGHSHDNIDTEIGNTKILSNQLRYLFNGQQAKGFSESKFIELS